MSTLNPQGKRVAISQLLPEIRANVKGIDPNLALQLLMDSLIQLARETGAMRQTICIPLQPCIGSYMVDASPDVIYSLESTKIVGLHTNTMCHNYKPEDVANRVHLDTTTNTVYLDPEPSQSEEGMMLILEVTTIPNRDGDTMPEDLYLAWADAVVYLCLAKVYKMADKDWYSMQATSANYKLYEDMKREIRRNILLRGKSLNIRLRAAKGLRHRGA